MKRNNRIYYFVNAITLYRMLVAPLLIFLIFNRNLDIFKWLFGFSFFTDVLDGWLARKLHVTSILGSKLDSVADDLTIVVGIIGVIVLKPEFLIQQLVFIIPLLLMFLLQLLLAFMRYGKISSFHTYMAKLAALMQGSFLILFFFLQKPMSVLFYIALFVTVIDLIEEIILVLLLPIWQTNVKGLYWVLKEKQKKHQ